MFARSPGEENRPASDTEGQIPPWKLLTALPSSSEMPRGARVTLGDPRAGQGPLAALCCPLVGQMDPVHGGSDVLLLSVPAQVSSSSPAASEKTTRWPKDERCSSQQDFMLSQGAEKAI